MKKFTFHITRSNDVDTVTDEPVTIIFGDDLLKILAPDYMVGEYRLGERAFVRIRMVSGDFDAGLAEHLATRAPSEGDPFFLVSVDWGIFPGSPFYNPKNDSIYQALQVFLAQPRYVDPYKGWSPEELQGPYTRMAPIDNLYQHTFSGVYDPDGQADNLTVRPRAILIPSTLELNPADVVSTDTNDDPLPLSTFPTNTILPIRIIYARNTNNLSNVIALW
jgi:hypothetical protein